MAVVRLMIRSICALLIVLVSWPAWAQTFTRSMLLQQNQQAIIPYSGSVSTFLNQGAVSPTGTNGMFNNLIQAMGVLADTNTWSGPNTFTGPLTVLGPFNVKGVNPITPQSFGATCNGVNDDTVAVFSWWAAIAAGSIGYVPGGSVCTTTRQLSSTNGVTVYGDGAARSQLLYTGTTTAGSIFTIGPISGSATTATHLSGIDFETSTAMTSGYVLLIQNCSLALVNYYNDLWVGVANNKSFDAVGLDNPSTYFLNNFWFQSHANEALDVWASSAAGSGAGGFLHNGLLINSGVGLHIGGNIGGFYTSLVSFGGNDQNVLIDEALGGATNLQIEFGNFTTFDIARAGKSLAGVELGTSGSAIQQIIMFDVDWFSIGGLGGNGCELQVDSTYHGYIYVNGTVFTNGSYGTCTASTNAHETISSNYYESNLTQAINDTGSNTNITFGPNQYDSTVAVGISTLSNGVLGNVGGSSGNLTWAASIIQSRASSAANAMIQMVGSGGPTNANNFDQIFNAPIGSLQFRAVNDAYSSGNVWQEVHRDATTPTGVQFAAPVALPSYTISGLPTCSSGGFTTTTTNVPVGSEAYISNGVATPTFGAAVSATGSYGHHVTCANSNGTYGWIYE